MGSSGRMADTLRYREFAESRRRDCIVVDIQPAYSKYCDHLFPGIIPFWEDECDDILVLYVGEDLGLDRQHQVSEYYLDKGVPEEIIERMEFIDKGYAFFRPWMDQGVDEDDIVKVAQYMLRHRLYDSRNIPEDVLDQLAPDRPLHDHLFLPGIENRLKRWSGSWVVGGGCSECLAETIILMDALKMRYKVRNEHVY